LSHGRSTAQENKLLRRFLRRCCGGLAFWRRERLRRGQGSVTPLDNALSPFLFSGKEENIDHERKAEKNDGKVGGGPAEKIRRPPHTEDRPHTAGPERPGKSPAFARLHKHRNHEKDANDYFDYHQKAKHGRKIMIIEKSWMSELRS